MTRIIKQRYQLLNKLGQGGFGAVYRAFDQMLNREVAIKVLKVNSENQEEIVQRFQVESQLVSRLEHSNILRVYDFGKDEAGRCFLVTELLKGESLHALLKPKSSLDLSLALDILYQVGLALEVAHAQKIIHRDIKPPNIFLNQPMSGSNFVKLLDFGIAKVVGGDNEPQESLTVTGQIMGTPHYMSPEQIVNIKLVDHRSDIYSLGIVLYQMLIGQVPFDDESYFSVMKKQMQSSMPPLSLPHLSGDLANELQEIVSMMTHKDVRRRVNNITEVLTRVRHIWANYPKQVASRTTGVFGAVTEDRLIHAAPKRTSSKLESINQMLEPFQNGDAIVDQMFGESKSGSSRESITPDAQALSSEELKFTKAPSSTSAVEERTHSQVAHSQVDQPSSPKEHLSNTVSPLPETELDLSQTARDRRDLKRPLQRKSVDPKQTSAPSAQSQASASTQTADPKSSSRSSSAPPERTSPPLSASEAPVSQSLFDSNSSQSFAESQLDTILETKLQVQSRSKYLINSLMSAPRALLFGALISALIVISLVIAVTQSHLSAESDDPSERGLHRSRVITTSPTYDALSTSAHEDGSSRAVASRGETPVQRRGVKSDVDQMTQLRAHRDSGQGITSTARQELTQESKQTAQAPSTEPTREETREEAREETRETRASATSKRVQDPKGDHKTKKSRRAPSQSSTQSKPHNTHRETSLRKRLNKRKRRRQVKLSGRVKLQPEQLIYEPEQKIKLSFPKSGPRLSKLEIKLGRCASWVSRRQLKVKLKQPKSGGQCVIKACYSKDCIRSPRFTVIPDPLKGL